MSRNKKKGNSKKRMVGNLIGYITNDGIEHEGQIYSFGIVDTSNGRRTTLFICSSWARQEVEKFIGRKVIFAINNAYEAYNIGLLDKNNKIIKI